MPMQARTVRSIAGAGAPMSTWAVPVSSVHVLPAVMAQSGGAARLDSRAVSWRTDSPVTGCQSPATLSATSNVVTPAVRPTDAVSAPLAMPRPGSGDHGAANDPVRVAVELVLSDDRAGEVDVDDRSGAARVELSGGRDTEARGAQLDVQRRQGDGVGPERRRGDVGADRPCDRPIGRPCERPGEIGVRGLAEQPQTLRHDRRVERSVTAGETTQRQVAPRCRGGAGQLDEAAVETGGGPLGDHAAETDAREGARPVDRPRDRGRRLTGT